VAGHFFLNQLEGPAATTTAGPFARDALSTGGMDLQRRGATKDEMLRDPSVFHARRTVAAADWQR